MSAADFSHEPDFREPVDPGTWGIAICGFVPCLEIRTANARITLVPRPPYCDRGRWTAHVDVRKGLEHPHRLALDFADMWPRMYFDLDRAKLECEAWLRARGELPMEEPAA